MRPLPVRLALLGSLLLAGTADTLWNKIDTSRLGARSSRGAMRGLPYLGRAGTAGRGRKLALGYPGREAGEGVALEPGDLVCVAEPAVWRLARRGALHDPDDLGSAV